MTERFQDKNYLRQHQYKDGSNLDARAALHRRFSTAPQRWPEWVFDQLALGSGMRVLECGCGPGWLWCENAERVPPNCAITLTDLSPGMVAEAQTALAAAPHPFIFHTANIETLPFEDNAFDLVIANHMLYHVANLPQALGEVRRVLRPHGRFIAATNGRAHLRELWQLLTLIIPPPQRHQLHQGSLLSFRLENGRAQLAPFFSTIERRLYPDSLTVTEVQPIIDYLLSGLIAQATELHADSSNAESIKTVRQYVTKIIEEQGAFHIKKATGLFIATP